MTTSNPTTSRMMKLKSMPWLMKQPWHTDNEKKRMEGLWKRLYLEPPEGREEVYEKYKPDWMEEELSFEERLERLRKEKWRG